MGKTIIYAADVTALSSPALFAEAFAMASPERKEKVGRIKPDNEKRLSLGAEMLLRHGLKEAELDNFPPEFSYNEHGKPYLKDGGKFFSISHSGSFAVCAISELELGCDIEKIRPANLRIARRFCKEEYDCIMSAKPDMQPELFFRYWTLKESYMKATGLGLTLGLNEFQIVMDPDVSIIQAGEKQSFSFGEFDGIAGYKCAVCTVGECCDAEFKIVDLNDIIGVK